MIQEEISKIKDKVILIVDDYPYNLTVVDSILRNEGYKNILMATSGSETLSLINETKPDLILLDIMMPDMDGFEVCKTLKDNEETKDIPVIMLTAKISSKDLKKAFEVGASDYIEKPFDNLELIARIESALKLKQSKADELRQSEEKSRILAKNTSDIIMTVDRNGIILSINRTVPGITVEEATGTSIYDYVPPEHSETMKKSIEQVFKTQMPDTNEVIGTGPCGPNTSWYETRVIPMEGDNEVNYVTLISTDITERKRADNLVKTQRDLGLSLSAVYDLKEGLRLCVEAALRVSDMDCGGVYLVDETTKALNLEFHMGLPPDFVSSASHFESDSDNFRLVMAGKPVYTQHHDLGVPLDEAERSEGLRAIAVIPIYHENKVIGCINIASHSLEEVPLFARDALEAIAAQIGSVITRLKSEKSLQESEERYQAIVEGCNDGVVIFKNFKPVFVNKRVLDMTGYRAEEISGLNFMKCANPGHLKEALSRYNRRMAGKVVPQTFEMDIYHKDGHVVPVELSSAKIEYEGGPSDVIFIRDISERRQADEVLQESEERYEMVLESIEDGYYEGNISGKLTFFNESFKRIFGYTESEMIGMSAKMFVGEGGVKKVFEIFGDLYRTGKPAKLFNSEIIRKDGVKRFIEGSASLIRNSQGKAIGFRGIVRDITERKLAEDAIRESEKRYSSVVELSPDGIILLQNLNVVFANQRIYEMSGYDELEINNVKFFSELIPKDQRKVLIKRYIGRMKGKEVPAIYELQIKKKDGNKIWVEVNGNRIEYNGKPANLLFIRDITERKKAENKLIESEKRYSTIVEGSTEGIVILKNIRLGRGVKLAFANQNIADMSGYTIDELLKMDLIKVIPPKCIPKALYRYRRRLAGDNLSPYTEIEVIHKDGHAIPIEMSSTWMEYQGEKAFVLFIRDITERKLAENKIRESEEKYSTVVEMSTDGIALIQDGKPVFANRAAFKLFDFEESEVKGKNLIELFGKDVKKMTSLMSEDEKRMVIKYASDLLKGKITAHTYQIPAKNRSGKVIWVEIRSSPITYKGKIAELIFVRDITESKRADRALKESEKRYSTIAEEGNDGIIIVKGLGIAFANKKMADMVGYTPEDLQKIKNLMKIINPEYINEALDRYRRRMEGKEVPQNLYIELIHKDGHTIPIELSSTIIEYKGGPADLIFLRDISERKQA